MPANPPVILYRYDTSPYSVKIDHILVLKNIPHQTVDVSSTLPRPEITDLLGISYRRIPILAIGNDVYCDTSLIVQALERRFPAAAGYGTIFPQKKHGGGTDTGLVKALSDVYVASIFPLSVSLLPWDKFPASFLEDRGLLRGAPINVEGIMASRGRSLAMLSSHLLLLEEQLSDGREWVFDTVLPGLADISFHFLFNWTQNFRPAKPVFDAEKLPHTLKWLARMSDFLDRKRKNQALRQPISGHQAAESIVSSRFEPYNVVGFDKIEGERLQLEVNDIVQVAPEDTGRNYPTRGKLVALNKEEVTIEVNASKGLLRCHFPILGFTSRPVILNKL